MVDIECSYTFSSRFWPAPTDTVLEEDNDQLDEDMEDEEELVTPKKKKARTVGGESAPKNMG